MEQYLLFNHSDFPVLSTLILLPLAGAIVCLFIRNEIFLKLWGLAVTAATMALSLPLYFLFDQTSDKYQFAELGQWIPALKLDYVVGVDGISLPLVLLTTCLMPLCILCSWSQIKERLAEFIFVLLIMESSMLGVFISLNTVLFYIFWEGMLIPMYLLIAVWGGPRRDYASIKFFLYTFVGSVFLLIALIVLYVRSGSFFIPDFMRLNYPFNIQMMIFICCAITFAIKMPMYPFHTWLPAAHVEAPTAGSVILASVLLKMGGYGFLRFCLPIAPAASVYCAPVIIVMSLAAIVIGGYLALGQSDVKKLIAYSSVAHMGFVTLGIFLFNMQGVKGAILQMVNHGITTGALFICIGIIYERTHSRELAVNKALGMLMPAYVFFLGIFSLSSFGFPGTNGFVGEFMVLAAAFSKYILVGAIAVPGAVLAAAYMLRMLQKMVWADSDGHHHAEPEGAESHHALADINPREWFILSVLTVLVFWLGFKPGLVLDIMDQSVRHLLMQVVGFVR
jgi:NADH-quinone oxidoreductase subunit M